MPFGWKARVGEVIRCGHLLYCHTLPMALGGRRPTWRLRELAARARSRYERASMQGRIGGP